MSIRTIETGKMILCTKYCQEKKSVAIGNMDGTVSIYTFEPTLKKIMTLSDLETEYVDNAVTSIIQRSNVRNMVTATYSGGLIKKWNCLTGQCMYTLRERRQTMGLLYHPRMPKFFTFGDDGRVILYDEETAKIEAVYQPSERKIMDGHVTKICGACFNPDNANEFVTGGWDTTVQFWDIRKSVSVRHISDILLGGDGLTINKSGTELITCEWKRDTPMKLWHYPTGKLIEPIVPDNDVSQLYCGRFINNHIVVTGGSDYNIFRIVDLRTKRTRGMMRDLSGGVYGIDLSGKRFISAAIKAVGDEITVLPTVLFCSGQVVYEVKFN